MKLNQISDNLGARKKANRVGRGMATGNGKTAGRGHKGQKARSGGNIMLGFEGGQNPLYRRLPMRGFNNHNFRTVYTTVNVGDLQEMVDQKRLDANKTITIESLMAAGLTKKAKDGLKVLGDGELKTKLTIEAVAASKSAQDKISKAGGKITLLAASSKKSEASAEKKTTAKKAPAKKTTKKS